MFSVTSNQPPRSLRFRLTALFVAIFGAAFVLIAAILYRVVVYSQSDDFDAALYNHASDVAEGISVDFFGDLSVSSAKLLGRGKVLPFSLGKALVQITDASGDILVRSATLGQRNLPLTHDTLAASLRGQATFQTLEGRDLRPISTLLASGGYRMITFKIEKPMLKPVVLQIAVPTTLLEHGRSRLLTLYFTLLPLVLIAATVAGLYLSRRALLPVAEIIRNANAIHPSELSRRVPVPDTGDEIQSLALTLNDLLDRLQEGFESQERFVADASHQLKTPLAILRGEIDLLRSGERDPAKVSLFLDSAAQEIQHLSRMVEDLLVLARIDTRSGGLKMREVRLDELLLECISRMERLARNRGIQIRLDFAGTDVESSSYEVAGDPGLLQAMLQNLLDNAIKYSPDGAKVELRLSETSEEIEVRVTDQGPGIAPGAKDKIFERFYRGEAGQSIPGAGLGLPIAKRIAELHGGSIQIDRSSETGTTFVVRIRKAAKTGSALAL